MHRLVGKLGRFAKLTRTVRMLRLLRVLKLMRLFRRFMDFYGQSLTEMINQLKIGLGFLKFFVILFLLAHWAACAWRLFGDADMQESAFLSRVQDLPSIAGADPGWAICEPGGPC